MSVLPERTILTLLQRGVDAIEADLAASGPDETVLDDILAALDSAERTKARAYYAAHKPTIVQGYPRTDAPFPLFAVVLQGDNEENRYVGTGEHDLAMMGVKEATAFNQWTKGQFGIYVYAEHPDICAWYYRILRRIMQVGIRYLVSEGLDNPSISGAELAPDPRYTPDNLFVRRLTLTVEYDEEWTSNDALWSALNGPPEPFITDPGAIDVRHVDSNDPLDGGPPGGVVPVNLTIDLNP